MCRYVYPPDTKWRFLSATTVLLQDVEMEESETRVLEVADPHKQTSLQAENELDPMEGEQTWPTEEELAQAQGTVDLTFARGPFSHAATACT